VTVTIEQAIRGPHHVINRIQVAVDPATGWLRDGSPQWSDPVFRIITGSITESLEDDVTRSLNLTVVSDIWHNVFEALKDISPYKTLIKVERGVLAANLPIEQAAIYRESLLQVLGVFRVTDVKLASAGGGAWGITVEAYSREVDVRDDRFEESQLAAGDSIANHIKRYIQEPFREPTSVPFIVDLPVGHRLTTTMITTGAVVTTERDRLGIVNQLEKDSDVWGRFDRFGDYRISPFPKVTDPPKWRVDTGESGVLVSYDKDYSRAGIYNSVIVIGENRETGETFRAVARDSVLNSPTFYGGPFGKVPRFYYSPLIRSQGAANEIAASLLQKSLSRRSGINFSAIPNPAIQVGDVVETVYEDGSKESHLITQLTIGLGVDAAMTATTAADPETQAEMQDL
jgi:hypothetical protein